MGDNETNEISWMQIKMPHYGLANDANCAQKKTFRRALFWALDLWRKSKPKVPGQQSKLSFSGNMRILEQWMLISILFPNCPVVWKRWGNPKVRWLFIILGRCGSSHDFRVEIGDFFVRLPSPPPGLSPTSQLWTWASRRALGFWSWPAYFWGLRGITSYNGYNNWVATHVAGPQIILLMRSAQCSMADMALSTINIWGCPEMGVPPTKMDDLGYPSAGKPPKSLHCWWIVVT